MSLGLRQVVIVTVVNTAVLRVEKAERVATASAHTFAIDYRG